MTTVRDWLGTGWSYPVAPDAGAHHLTYQSGPEKIRESLRLILETESGERIMRPTFGCGLRRFLMEPNNVATRTLIHAEVSRAIETWEPRIEVQELAVLPGDDASVVMIVVRYEHRRTGRGDLLVYPYSLETAR